MTSGPVGLDRRRRPASVRQRLFHGLIQSAPFSSLQRRIIFFNLIGLAILVLGVLYLNQFRTGLIEQRVDALRVQGEIIATTIAESSAMQPGSEEYDPERANVVLSRLTQPTGVRARLYDRELILTGDTRALTPAGAPIESQPLPAVESRVRTGFFEQIEDAYIRLISLFREETPIYAEVPRAGVSHDPEVITASAGDIGQAIRVNSEGELILSVAIPIRRVSEVMGVLVLSTEGDDINRIVRRERVVILQVFIMATAVSVALSVLLANTIANPIRRLAEAADPDDDFAQAPINPEKVELPDLTNRTDEIGDLSAALIRMTRALYKRIEAIESFAADVAHEIKNPLTSLRSAVETIQYARSPEQRQRLVDVIKHDVRRLDRLVTDISNASRLDAELVRERMETFDLGQLITMLGGVTEMHGAERNVRIVTKLPDDGPLMARGLEGRLAQVITNLLDNALSFSPENGAIVIEGKRGGNGSVRLEIMDQGPGIPPDNVESIFERFYSERPETEGFGNHSGLGLSISKQIIEAHNGRIWAENIFNPTDDESPVGARFIIELPG